MLRILLQNCRKLCVLFANSCELCYCDIFRFSYLVFYNDFVADFPDRILFGAEFCGPFWGLHEGHLRLANIHLAKEGKVRKSGRNEFKEWRTVHLGSSERSI